MALHITCACPTPIKGLGCFVVCAGCEGGNARTPQLHVSVGYVGGWVGGWMGVRPPPPPPGGGWDICRFVGMPKFWVGGSLN